jgi:hypothetical protein
MFEIKKSYEEFKQDDKDRIEKYNNFEPDWWVSPMAPIGTYKIENQKDFTVVACTIDGKDVPKKFGGPMDGKAIEFFLCCTIGYCADSEEAYNEFVKKINGKIIDGYSPLLEPRFI